MTNLNCEEKNICGLRRADFKKTIDGKKTDLFILRNKRGSELAVTNYGGAVAALMVPDKNGKFINVIQGHDTIDNIIHSAEPHLSTLVGRYANRIADGEFYLGGKKYQLAVNNGPNHLHGGPTGFHARIWDADMINGHTLKLHYHSHDGEEGFPGNLDVYIVYKLTDENEFVIKYFASTDRMTIANLTHHGYYNLAGLDTPTSTVGECELVINADHYLPTDETCIPTGEIASVEGTPMDFRKPHRIGERIDADFEALRIGAGYDHCYVVNKKEPGKLAHAATCYCRESGIEMEMWTTEPGVQLYTANYNDGFAGWHGCTFPRRSAVCLEAQRFPDTPNKGHFPSCVVRPGDEYSQTTIYKFMTKD